MVKINDKYFKVNNPPLLKKKKKSAGKKVEENSRQCNIVTDSWKAKVYCVAPEHYNTLENKGILKGVRMY